MLRRRVLAVLILVAAVCAGAWGGREWLLRSAANLWIVSDPIETADAVAIFGGGLPSRPFAAAEYYRRGLVKKVLVAGVSENPAERLGAVVSETERNSAVLVKL